VAFAGFVIAAFVGVVALLFGIVHPLVGDWSSTVDRFIFGGLAGGGGFLIVAGLFGFERRPWPAAAAVIVGAAAASLALFWTLLLPLLTFALVPLMLVRARRLTVAA
jgi:hypothetical protein